MNKYSILYKIYIKQMFWIHCITILNNSVIAYGFDEYNKEFIIALKEITPEAYDLQKQLINESRLLIECSNKFYDIDISIETIFNRNISILNDNMKHDLINRMKRLSSFDITDIAFIRQDNYSINISIYGINSVIWIVMNGMISSRI